MGEIAPGAPHLPDPFVRGLPDRLDEVDQPALERPGVVVARKLGALGLIEAVDHLAVDVELKLIAGGVADAHRPGALVAGEPVERLFGEPALTAGP